MLQTILEYAKGVVAAFGSLATVVSAALADDAISLDEVEGIRTAVIALLTVLGVIFTRNADPA